MISSWDPDFAQHSAMFQPLRVAAADLGGRDWPDHQKLNQMLAARASPILTASGHRLRLVEAARGSKSDLGFEARIFQRGEAQIRAGNWHDLFNVLTWFAYPRAKAMLNARHAGAAQPWNAGNRSAAQDALTLLDESGVVVASSSPHLEALLRNFSWKELFWQQRAAVCAQMRFYLFGHDLFAKALAPFTGFTGHAFIVTVDEHFLGLESEQQASTMDRVLAAQLSNRTQLNHSHELAPLPLLGIPGWWDENESAGYYDNAAYFRPGRQRAIQLR